MEEPKANAEFHKGGKRPSGRGNRLYIKGEHR